MTIHGRRVAGRLGALVLSALVVAATGIVLIVLAALAAASIVYLLSLAVL